VKGALDHGKVEGNREPVQKRLIPSGEGKRGKKANFDHVDWRKEGSSGFLEQRRPAARGQLKE